MAVSKRKEVRLSLGSNPRDRDPRAKSDPVRNRRENPSWNVRLADPEGPWSFRNLSCRSWWNDIYAKLCDFETMTWQEILDASGGRVHGNNNHEIPTSVLVPAARRRLKKLRMDDIDVLFSLRLTGRKRIWGILDGSVLKLLWYDPNHEIYPSMKN
jgi:hypothetical protein